MAFVLHPTVRIRGLGLWLLLLGLWGCAANGILHPVREGETLYRISKAYGVDEHYLARINGIGDPARIRAGDRIFIPGVEQPRTVAPLKTDPVTARSTPPAPSAPSGAKPSPRAAQPGKTPPAAPTARAAAPAVAARPKQSPPVAPTVAAGSAPDFAWPLRGEILRRFGAAGTPPSKGLEIAASSGARVTAAAAGKVIYSGDGIRSYGNLIIIRHDDAFFTVYGYNERNLVTAGSFVSKGDRIALVGTPPAGGKARLYFEIRRGKDAVNPTIYLP